MAARHVGNLVLVGAIVAQVAFAIALRERRPFWEVVPPVPTERALGAVAFGDNQLLYRVFVMNLQNFGDTGGRLTALQDYDMPDIVEWLHVLDRLDYSANHHVALAAQYFSQTQNKPDVIHLVRYLQEHVDLDPEKKLNWLRAALHMARVRLEDDDVAMGIADQLATYSYEDMSVTAYQLPAFIYANSGRFAEAAELMERARALLKHKVTEEENRLMLAYIDAFRQRAEPLSFDEELKLPKTIVERACPSSQYLEQKSG